MAGLCVDLVVDVASTKARVCTGALLVLDGDEEGEILLLPCTLLHLDLVVQLLALMSYW